MQRLYIWEVSALGSDWSIGCGAIGRLEHKTKELEPLSSRNWALVAIGEDSRLRRQMRFGMDWCHWEAVEKWVGTNLGAIVQLLPTRHVCIHHTISLGRPFEIYLNQSHAWLRKYGCVWSVMCAAAPRSQGQTLKLEAYLTFENCVVIKPHWLKDLETKQEQLNPEYHHSLTCTDWISTNTGTTILTIFWFASFPLLCFSTFHPPDYLHHYQDREPL